MFKWKVGFSNGTPGGAYSIWRQRYVADGAEEIAVGEQDRSTFAPGEFARVAEYVEGAENAEEITAAFNVIWTPRVIEAWEAAHPKRKPEEPEQPEPEQPEEPEPGAEA